MLQKREETYLKQNFKTYDMTLTDHKTIGEIVADDYRSAAVFKKYGIDFCCKGGRTIEEACEPKKVDPQNVYSELEKIGHNEGGDIDFNAWPLDLLADYVEKTHHRYVEEKIPYIMQFLDKICRVHGGRHPELFEVNQLFSDSARDLSAHLKKEELILFPFVRVLENAKRTNASYQRPGFDTVENPVTMMMDEHTTEGERFEKISKLTDGYTTPADGCKTYEVAFRMLEEFENDLHRHIHIENNILFPRAIRLEKELTK